MAKPKVIAVANQKGGVGKSTSVYNIGAGLAMNGKNILLIDVDPQGDLTKMLGQRKPHDLPVTLGNALNDVVADTENSSHPEILRHHEGFDFVPANRTLSAVEVSLVNVMSRETVLRRYVNSVKKPYDYVLLDCNPSLGMLVINALSASDYVLIPVQADYLAAEDMTELVGTVQNVKKGINHNLKIGGVFLTMANETNFRKEVVSAVKENFGKHLPVLQAVIPATVRLAEISTADKSIFRHEPRGKAAEAYRPVLIIQNDVGNKYSPTVIVAAVTSKVGVKPKLPTHCFIEANTVGLTAPSIVLLEQLRTLDKRRLERYIGRVDSCHIREINRALAVSVGLMEEMPENLIMCLCPTCANNFYGTGSYFLRRISADDSEKDICTYCGQRRGFDYEVVQRPKDNEKE